LLRFAKAVTIYTNVDRSTLPRRIAIVDDDASVRAAIRGVIESGDLHAVVFPSAEAFLASGELQSTACIVTDVQMPGMSGFDLQRRLAENGAAVPVIFVSAYGSEENRQRAMRAGAVAFLVKPFDGDALLDIVRRVMRLDPAPE
jgi:FixJ family two-component response regulator